VVIEKIAFGITEFIGRDGRKHEAVGIGWEDVQLFLDHPYGFDESDDDTLTAALLRAGAPSWVKDADVWVDHRGWGLVGPEKATPSETLVYWRRQRFPVESADEVEVLNPAEYAAEYGGKPELGPGDCDWHAIQGEKDSGVIEFSLGLRGQITEITLLCDAMNISDAIHWHLSLSIEEMDGEDCVWNLDSHRVEEIDKFFETVERVYGEDTADTNRIHYAKAEALAEVRVVNGDLIVGTKNIGEVSGLFVRRDKLKYPDPGETIRFRIDADTGPEYSDILLVPSEVPSWHRWLNVYASAIAAEEEAENNECAAFIDASTRMRAIAEKYRFALLWAIHEALATGKTEAK
jgi:hypothetical protein